MVSDISVSAEKISYEAIVVMGELMWGFSAMLVGRKEQGEVGPFFILSLHTPFPPRKL